MKLNHEVVGANWDDEQGVWHVEVKDLVRGVTFLDTAEVLINGMGVLKYAGPSYGRNKQKQRLPD